MKNLAVEYHREGYNCSQCILKAVECKYRVNIPIEVLNSCSAVSNGFGYGGICSALVAGVMVFGILGGEDNAKSMRIKMFTRFQEIHESFNCGQLVMEKCQCRNCDTLISEIAEIIENILIEEKCVLFTC